MYSIVGYKQQQQLFGLIINNDDLTTSDAVVTSVFLRVLMRSL